MAHSSIVEDQRSSIRQMLSLGEAAAGPTQTWKVLVFDKFCQDVIAPLMKVGALRNHGVTLNLKIDNERLPVSDVPCVYFVEPTKENIDRIGDDLQKGLYETCYINFASAVPRSMLEALAKGALHANGSQKVAGVFDRYVSFVSMSPTMFSLNLPAIYSTIHSPSIADEIMYAKIERIVDGLLSALVTMKILPIIRCPPNEVAEMVARRLDERLRDLLAKNAELFATPASRVPGGDAAGGAANQRPVLCIVDRDVDLVTMVNHTWTYQAMCHDVLAMRLKKLKVPGDGDGSKEKAYDIDDSDSFWAAHAAEPFPAMAEAVHAAIEEFKRKKADMSKNDGEDPAAEGLNPNLAAAINALPEMTEKKRSIDMHTNIATALLQEIKERDLANYYEMEDRFASQSTGTSVSQLEQLFSDSQRVSRESNYDKTRALMSLYLTKPSIPPAQLQALKEALARAGGDESGVAYLEHLSSIRNMMTPSAAVPTASGPAGGSLGGALGSLANTFMSKGEDLLSAGVSQLKNITQSKKELVICQILECVMEQKPGVADNYVYLDPKAPAGAGPDAPRVRGQFRRAVAFVVGGGNYVEMQSVDEWAKANGRVVSYGSTDMVSPKEFVEELSSLGKAMGGGSGGDLR